MMSPRRSSIGSEAEEVMADSTRGSDYGVGTAEIGSFPSVIVMIGAETVEVTRPRSGFGFAVGMATREPNDSHTENWGPDTR